MTHTPPASRRHAAVASLAAAALVLLASACPAQGAQTAVLDSLGLHPGKEPLRARPGWHTPHLVLYVSYVKDSLPLMQKAAPGVKFVEVSQASAKELASADATIGVCSAEVLAKATHLEWVQWMGAGVEGCVQQPLLRERNVVLTNMQRTAAPSMAEHVIALMLALSRHLDVYLRAQDKAQWVRDEGTQLNDLDGKTLLVVGLGGIGTEVAKRAHALGMRVIATRASGHEGPDYVSYVGLPDELLKLTREADYVVNCLPLTRETTGLFNAQFFATMKPSAYFLSVGRGKSTVTADLVSALESRRIAGAGLDVVDPEPLPPDSPLWKLPNVLITPHISAYTAVTMEQRDVLLSENLRRFVAGDALLAVVDVERGY
ncbi:MAG TPA: D-2-hydroxyacid dehydrogenase [Steroidobacteraceae bacterium]|nr:D-2-hydroxyacid dehydrogenase [Steroidobacteraceae bacterium]